jgi:sugar (pentulose or hexulose) kinase
MGDHRHVAVIDIGKTNAKVVLVEMATLSEVAVLKTPNLVLQNGPYAHFDIETLWSFILDGLAKLQRIQPIDAITVTTHGACAALLDGAGELVTPVLDYEYDAVNELASSYNSVRPNFSETGSPRLPMGLNLGAQIYWLFETFPALRSKVSHIVTYPQYWISRLTGICRNEATSLGCHTDLWCPVDGNYSSMVEEMGWGSMMPPLCKAHERIGTILPEVSAETGLSQQTEVYGGIHDSNASLYPHLKSRKAPFSVVSTGTWVVCMAVGGKPVKLDPARDTLINVNGLGDPVMSSRFMGGREHEILVGEHAPTYSQAEVDRVLKDQLMLMPSVEPSSGPFPGQNYQWLGEEHGWTEAEKFIATSFYLALMTATCLDLIGADGDIIIEGPFASNELICVMLAASAKRQVVATAGTGTSTGAAMLTTEHHTFVAPKATHGLKDLPDLSAYADTWVSMVHSLKS